VKNPNITGIIHNIIRFVESWVGDVEGIVVIFCITNIDTPTNTGRTIFVGSGTAKSSPKKSPFNGTALCTEGSHQYNLFERVASRSGVEGSVCIIA
jgi:hypothetical protein